MNIWLNGEARAVNARNLAALLSELELEGQPVATALNGGFVRRQDRERTPVSEGDRIEIVSPRQGG